MEALSTVSLFLISAAAAVYLFRVWMIWRKDKQIKVAVADALDVVSLPEAGWAEMLVKARREMQPDQYEKFEKGIHSVIARLNEINTSGLKTEKERLDAFADPNSKPPAQ